MADLEVLVVVLLILSDPLPQPLVELERHAKDFQVVMLKVTMMALMAAAGVALVVPELLAEVIELLTALALEVQELPVQFLEALLLTLLEAVEARLELCLLALQVQQIEALGEAPLITT
jgi:hypothetical protein